MRLLIMTLILISGFSPTSTGQAQKEPHKLGQPYTIVAKGKGTYLAAGVTESAIRGVSDQFTKGDFDALDEGV